jgi:hypothetical protein
MKEYFRFIGFLMCIIYSHHLTAQVLDYSQKWATAGYYHHWEPQTSGPSFTPGDVWNQSSEFESSYNWKIGNNTKNTVVVNLTTPEKAFIYVQKDKSDIIFEGAHLDGANDNDYWSQISSVRVDYDTDCNGTLDASFIGTATSPIFTTTIEWTGYTGNLPNNCDSYELQVDVVDFVGEEFQRNYTLIQVPPSDEFHYEENDGSTLTKWNATHIPADDAQNILIVEGFDAKSIVNPESYREGIQFYLDCGYNVYILDFIKNAQRIQSNAAVVQSAARYISSINGDEKITLAGLSMGAVITRYALAKSEEDGDPLPVKNYLSVDGPQQGAVIDIQLQHWQHNTLTRNPGIGCIPGSPSDFDLFKLWGLDNPAAWQLLKQHTRGFPLFPSSTEHINFYSILSSLNGGQGYPLQTKNIGVSFSNDQMNQTISDKWLSITRTGLLLNCVEQDFFISSETGQAGSWLPLSTVDFNAVRTFGGWIDFTRTPEPVNPTFIPHVSSLDLTGANTPFDVTVKPNTTTYHDLLPEEPAFIGQLFTQMDQSFDWFLQNYTENYVVGHKAVNAIEVGKNVTSTRPIGDFIVSNTGDLDLKAGEYISFKPGFLAEFGSDVYALVVPIESPECLDDGMKMMNTGEDNSPPDKHVSKEESGSSMDVYPNPNNGQFIISVDGFKGISAIEVFNTMGQMVFSKRGYFRRLEIDLMNQQNGIYLVRYSNGGEVITKKIIKQ